MRRALIALIVAVPVVLGQTKEWQSVPQQTGLNYLASVSGLSADDLDSVFLAKEYTTAHNGVTHLVYRQRFQNIEVANAAWVVNIGRDGVVLNSGGNLFPAPGSIDFGTQLPASKVVEAAAREVNPHLSITNGDFGRDYDGRLVWFAHRDKLVLAWLINMVDEDGVTAYDVAVEASTGAIIDKEPTTFFQAAPRGLVFDKGSPQPNPTPGARLLLPPPMVERTMLPLTGDPVASPMGWVSDNLTAGYNAIVGENLFGQSFLASPNSTQTAAGGNFSFPLSLGPLAQNPIAYTDAANVNLFYWVNRTHDLFYAYGFNEAAGNFQSNNYGRGGVGGDPVLAFTHYGAAAPFSPALNNAFFSARSVNDGSVSMIAMYVTSTGPAGYFADGAYAADVAVHEYTHGVSLRLLPNGYGSFQTRAMGEAWSDFFSLEFTLPEGSPVNGSYPVGEYWIQSWGTGIRTRPYSTDMGINPLTFSDLGHVVFYPEIHAEGEIWVETLWDARANLIQQFGEKEGRRRIRQLVIDGLMLCPPSPSMVDARDAILLADQVDFEGTSQNQLWSAFAKRGLGALSYSDSGNTIHVVSSFDVPSTLGKLKFHEETFVAGESIRVLLSDLDLSQPTVPVQLSTTSGDIETLVLRRRGTIYSGVIPSSNNIVARENGVVNIIPGDVVTALYSDVGSDYTGIQTTAASLQPYTLVFSTTPSTGLPTFPGETRLTSIPTRTPVTLPFDFPFFSKKYRSMIVDINGIIWFEPSISTSRVGGGCNDAAELSRLPAIAPLFANLNFGNAQQNEGIFISSSSTMVTIRWTAETFPAFPLLPPAVPEAINVAVSLTADGVITFYYGAGNQNLHTAFQTASTCGAQPTVGISNGHDVYARTVTLRTYNNAPNVSFYPAFNATTTPEVILERPAPDESVRGLMRVSGIAYEPPSQGLPLVVRRDVFIDGIERVIAGSASRADYCATNQVPGCPFVGFQADVNLSTLNLSPGRHSLFVRAMNFRGAYKDTPTVSFNVDSGPSRLPKGAIEAPAAGAEVSGTLVEFRGYAYADDLRVLRLDLLIDGVTYPGLVGANYGLSRPDICSPLPAPLPPNCPNVGWSVLMNTRSGSPPLPDGPHSMQIRILDETGRYTLVPQFPVSFTVKNGPQAVPVGAITSIKPNARLSGIVPISGYAYSPTGRITSVFLVIDGLSVAIAQYGQPRPEECATLNNLAACPNIGFSINLDTRTLTNGNHVLGARIVNDAGLAVTVPNLDSGGMNVTVDNR
jgi:Fungalysin metallopeptidase (M36)/Fungalysin/Thermolysin Propeptide Motif